MPPGAESESDEFSDSSSDSSSSEDLSSSEEERLVKQKTDNTTAAKTTTRGAESSKNQELKNQPFDEAMDLSDEDSTTSISPKASGKMSAPARNSKQELEIKNQPYDHALELSDSFSSPLKQEQQNQEEKSKSTTDQNKPDSIKNKPFDEELDLSEDSDSSVDTEKEPASPVHSGSAEPTTYVKRTTMLNETIQPMSSPPKSKSKDKVVEEDDEDEEEDDESEEDHDDDDDDDDAPSSSKEATSVLEGGYEDKEYAHLAVSQEIKELFQYIGRFKAQDVELETRLKCFIPEYIPAVGEMDAFLKVTRPNSSKEESIGLRVLDEPALLQSNATVLELQLRANSRKQLARADLVVRSIEEAEKHPKEITRWMTSIHELHRNKPPPQVHYTKSMPDIDQLMEAWPAEMEQLLHELEFPPVDMNVNLDELVRIMCAILDIPVYKNMAESLHVMFTLFLAFRENPHFAQLH